MKRGRVFFQGRHVGWIEEVEKLEERYRFRYSSEYLLASNAVPISVTLPLRTEPYASRNMLPFFDGLIPEGWLLVISQNHWKLNPNDRMGLLLKVCGNCIGAVSVEPDEVDELEQVS
jgi:serine/threonine-protein kinase HipA